MKKTTFILSAMAVMMAVFASACGGAQPAPTAAPAPTQAPAVAPPVEQPTEQVVQPTTAPAFAPTCANTTASCAAPQVVDTVANETYCVEKVPYINILIDEGVTWEELAPDKLTCSDSGTVVDGKRVLTCHGTELWTSGLKLTNSACGASTTLVTGTGQCPDGFGYDATQVCCAPVTGGTEASTTINVNIGGCPDSVQP
jgi:hypothetical protein